MEETQNEMNINFTATDAESMHMMVVDAMKRLNRLKCDLSIAIDSKRQREARFAKYLRGPFTWL